jgi:hypothetical protein
VREIERRPARCTYLDPEPGTVTDGMRTSAAAASTPTTMPICLIPRRPVLDAVEDDRFVIGRLLACVRDRP